MMTTMYRHLHLQHHCPAPRFKGKVTVHGCCINIMCTSSLNSHPPLLPGTTPHYKIKHGPNRRCHHHGPIIHVVDFEIALPPFRTAKANNNTSCYNSNSNNIRGGRTGKTEATVGSFHHGKKSLCFFHRQLFHR